MHDDDAEITWVDGSMNVFYLGELDLGIASGLDSETGEAITSALMRVVGCRINSEPHEHAEATYLLPFDRLRETGQLMIDYADSYDRGEVTPS